MAKTNHAWPTVRKNKPSNTFFGRCLSKKFSPVNREKSMPNPATEPTAPKRAHALRMGGRKMPATPTMVQATAPARGIANPRRCANSRCCSSKLRGTRGKLVIVIGHHSTYDSDWPPLQLGDIFGPETRDLLEPPTFNCKTIRVWPSGSLSNRYCRVCDQPALSPCPLPALPRQPSAHGFQSFETARKKYCRR